MNRLEQIGDELIDFLEKLFKKYPDLSKAEVLAVLEVVKATILKQYIIDYIRSNLLEIFDSRMLGA